MTSLQELIHKLEVGEWVPKLKIGAGVLVLAALAVWYDFQDARNFHAPESMEAAQLARNIAAGQGFVTKCIRPLSLSLVEQQQGIGARLAHRPHPDLVNPPVYPLALAGLMKVVPFHYAMGDSFLRYQPEIVINVFNQGLFFVMVLLAFFLARRLFDLPVAFFTAILLLGADLLWRFSVSGLPTMLLLLVFVGLLWALVALEKAAREGGRGVGWFIRWSVIVGLLLGSGGLTRYSFAWLALPVLAFCAVYLGPRRAVVCAVVAATFALVMTPWLVRNHRLSGTLFGVAGFACQQDTLPFPETRLERSLSPDLGKVGFRDYARKLLVNGRDILQNEAPRLGWSWMTAFFLVSLLLPYRNPALGRLRIFLILCLVTLGLAQALGHTHLSTDTPTVNSENLLVLLLVPAFMFGSGMFFAVLDQINLPFPEMRRWILGGSALVACAPLGFTLLPPHPPALVYPPYLPPWIQESATLLKKEELMMSDMPWAVAWYGDRTCVWTTLDSEASFYDIYDNQKWISALYLTSLTLDARMQSQILQGQDWAWSRFSLDALMLTNLPPRFPLQDARARYVPNQLLLCDRPRWRESADRGR